MQGTGIVFLLVAGYAVLAASQPLNDLQEQQWQMFKSAFGKSYDSVQEEDLRKTLFLKNSRRIEEHNKLYEQGRVSFTLKMNKFGDLSQAEFRRQMNGYRLHPRNPQNPLYTDEQIDALPAAVDWRKKGAVTPIKDQAQCGSCWSFSATGSLEGQHFLKTGKLVSLSEQNIMDCSWDQGNEGCNGGWMDQAFEYVKINNGVDTETSYPYEAVDGPCRFKKANVGATVANITDIKAKSEAALQSAVAKVGPISVAIDAGEFSFQFYGSGVYYESGCDPDELDHGVLAVGYGTNAKKQDYWIVKNSWGDSWGDNGYILMARNRNNNCGIATKASYPIV